MRAGKRSERSGSKETGRAGCDREKRPGRGGADRSPAQGPGLGFEFEATHRDRSRYFRD